MNLVVNGIEVRMSEDGLFCLNDLLPIIKKKGNYKPVYFLRNKETKDFIDILKMRNSTIGNEVVKTTRGRLTGGTWVCKELVYKYAMWISPEFMLDVIRAFDALVMGELATALKIASNSVYINKAGDEFDRIINDNTASGVKAMNDFANACAIYDKYAHKAGCDLVSCRGKPKKRDNAEKAIAERSQYTINFNIQ